MDPRQVLEDNLALVDRIVASVCRKRHLLGDEADDFGAWVKLRLLERQGAVFERYDGRSSLASYLTVVIWNLYRDHVIAAKGKWRPSREAARRGEVAIRLEALLYRDGLSLSQAAEVLRTNAGFPLSDREAAELRAALPVRRPRPKTVQLDPATGGATTPDSAFAASLRDRDRGRLVKVLDQALRELPREDEVILRMHWLDGHSLASVARTLGLEQKPLYRRVKSRIRDLKDALIAAGIDATAVRDTVLAES